MQTLPDRQGTKSLPFTRSKVVHSIYEVPSEVSDARN
jgi:hypothetical protein